MEIFFTEMSHRARIPNLASCMYESANIDLVYLNKQNRRRQKGTLQGREASVSVSHEKNKCGSSRQPQSCPIIGKNKNKKPQERIVA